MTDLHGQRIIFEYFLPLQLCRVKGPGVSFGHICNNGSIVLDRGFFGFDSGITQGRSCRWFRGMKNEAACSGRRVAKRRTWSILVCVCVVRVGIKFEELGLENGRSCLDLWSNLARIVTCRRSRQATRYLGLRTQGRMAVKG